MDFLPGLLFHQEFNFIDCVSTAYLIKNPKDSRFSEMYSRFRVAVEKFNDSDNRFILLNEEGISWLIHILKSFDPLKVSNPSSCIDFLFIYYYLCERFGVDSPGLNPHKEKLKQQIIEATNQFFNKLMENITKIQEKPYLNDFGGDSVDN